MKIAKIEDAEFHEKPIVVGAEQDDAPRVQKQEPKKDEPTQKSKQSLTALGTKDYCQVVAIRRATQSDQDQESRNTVVEIVRNESNEKTRMKHNIIGTAKHTSNTHLEPTTFNFSR